MKISLFAVAALTVLGVALVGCSKQPDAAQELERAAQEMQAEPPPAPAPAPVYHNAQPVPVQPPAQQMNDALASYKNGNYQDAVTRLQVLRSKAAMTPQQRMALQDAMAAVMTEIYTKAAQGDPRAQQAVKDYERMQNIR